jgi:hypothetical protein
MADKREIELRRRLWSYVFHHDRTASLLVGRPTLIPESSVDTLPPANLDDHDLLGDFPVEGKPMSQPTVMTHAVRLLPSRAAATRATLTSPLAHTGSPSCARRHHGQDQRQEYDLSVTAPACRPA